MATLKKTKRVEVLSGAKKIKSDELSIETQNHILNGFNHEISGITYHFSYDKEAQINLQDTMRLFDNNMIEVVNWTAKLHDGKVRLVLNKEMFEKLYVQSVKHKLDTISKFRDELMPLVDNAKTLEELEAIQWDTIPESSVKSVLNTDDTVDKNLNEIHKKTKALEEGNKRAMSGILELTNYMFMGGF